MRAIRIHETGGPETLTLEDVPVPEPETGQVRVRITAAGVNFIDTYHRAGRYPLPLPITLGVEAGGTIDAVGRDVEGFSVGDRVAYADQIGSYAEFQVAPASSLVPVPDDLDMEIAVASLLQGMTAHYLSHDTFRVEDGTTALVHAAAGGVGQLLTQMCKLRGGKVIATCGTHEKADIARGLGADEVIVYTEDSFVDVVESFTGGRGVDVVYDGVGNTTFDDGLRCLRPRGTMALYGQASGPVKPLDPQILNKHGSIFLTRPSLAHYVLERAELEQRASDLFGWINSSELKVTIDRTFPLEETAEAHRYLEGRNTRGKILLQP